MGNTKGSLYAKFQACEAKFEPFMAKKPNIGHFLPLFWLF